MDGCFSPLTGIMLSEVFAVPNTNAKYNPSFSPLTGIMLSEDVQNLLHSISQGFVSVPLRG